MDIKVKICGMTDPVNVKEVSESNPDFMGFIFYPRSLRYVGKDPDPELFWAVPEGISKVAVFVNEYYERMIEITGRYGIDWVQLHGMESPETCKALRNNGKRVVKVFPGDQLENLRLLKDYLSVADYFLFDTPVRTHGGSGRKFDWSSLGRLKHGKPFFLSGGISPDDAETVLQLEIRDLHAIDINSRFEIRPGIKDPALVRTFINRLRDDEA